ncbi:hypothetical protein PP175_29285 (plasmid) [Aneurinibacillus sp. Ricciae_BoGa-3]|uniref:hypothetical protein n=1 Tax=Aneurinibacillus sp. Ricciae_BoGa-3 TaxID=3022697 RepID=UPI00234016A7|nr:hypothetical protein [Aneurinibacillus sp. Ricciae_BoGa-3]WCK57286.1 hypothetical protein PP175_29285 [Aneurinibacillus sp. Ricciae_BoGa-3]
MNETLGKKMLAELMDVYDEVSRGLHPGKEKEEIQRVLSEINMALSRILMNIRHCHNADCPCQPENLIRNLVVMNQELLQKHLYTNQFIFLAGEFVKDGLPEIPKDQTDMKHLIGCIEDITRSGRIKTRFFYIDSKTKEVRDVTLELCETIEQYNQKAERIRATGEYAMKIPYDYKKGMAEYSFGCGLSHYLQEDIFEDISKEATSLTFPLASCKLSMYTHSDVTDILECQSVFDGKIQKSLEMRFAS